MKTFQGLLWVMVVVAAVGTATAGEEVAVQKARVKVEAKAKVALMFAYPTAKQLTDTSYEKGTLNRDGSVTLTYTLMFLDSDGDRAFVGLRYEFDKDGKCTGIRETDRSSVWPAFGTAKLTLELVKEAIKSDPKSRDNADAQKLLKITEPTQFLTELINFNAR